MKVEDLKVRTLKITEVEALDPITVYLENYEPGKGKITIECFGESWSSYWGGMSGDSVEKFFLRGNASYLIGNLSPNLRDSVPSFEGLSDKCRKEICQMRRDEDLSEVDARELWDECDSVGSVESVEELNSSHGEFMHKIWGDDWWYAVPDAPNPKYQYLERIVEAVQAAVQQLEDKEKAEYERKEGECL